MDNQSPFGATCPAGFEMSRVVVQPASSVAYRESQWADAVVVVEQGRLQVECWSGAQACFEQGAVLFLTGLELRQVTNPSLEPLVLKTIRRAPAPVTGRRTRS